MYLKEEPVIATFMGIHDYGDQLADYRLSALESKYQSLENAVKMLEAIDSSGFSKNGAIDLLLAQQVIKIKIFNYKTFAHHRTNPGFYLDEIMEGIFFLLLKNFAPLDERLKSILGRAKETPLHRYPYPKVKQACRSALACSKNHS